jgi:hypothetical protein
VHIALTGLIVRSSMCPGDPKPCSELRHNATRPYQVRSEDGGHDGLIIPLMQHAHARTLTSVVLVVPGYPSVWTTHLSPPLPPHTQHDWCPAWWKRCAYSCSNSRSRPGRACRCRAVRRLKRASQCGHEALPIAPTTPQQCKGAKGNRCTEIESRYNRTGPTSCARAHWLA